MSNNNDFDMLLAQLQTIQDRENLVDYHAFVYWFVDTVFGLEDKKILDSICDGTHDKGIDAIVIDHIEHHIIIIQSKFEHEAGQQQIASSEIKEFAAVKDYFKSRRALLAGTNTANQVARRLLDEAFRLIHDKRYTLELFFITTHKKAPDTDDLIRKTLGFSSNEFSVYDHKRVMQLLKDRLRDFTPLIAPYSLPYKDEDKAIIRTGPHRSWMFTVPLEEIRLLVNRHQDMLFRKNVRNFLGKSTTNKRIQQTLKDDSEHFWYYNNGITILCDEANLNVEGHYIRLVNPQIVNGCQTSKSIEKFRGDLSGEVFVRVIESQSHEFINSITLYQNSANPVKMRDFKSNDPIQVRLKHELERRGYFFEIKRGEEYNKIRQKYPSAKKQYPYAEKYGGISNELVAKLSASFKISPAIAASKGSETFFDDKDNAYSDLFSENISTANCLAPYILQNFVIKVSYKGEKEYFDLQKSYPFKNRALYYVLFFIYGALKKQNDWEKNLVKFFEKSEDEEGEWEDFYSKVKEIVNGYFDLIYKSWQSSTERQNHNSYLQNSSALKDIVKKNTKKLDALAEKISKIFLSLGSNNLAS
jgi:hypothetical protein